MFGDFEAQRHWMSVTINRKVQEWYFAEEDWWLLDCETRPVAGFPALTMQIHH